ncbi:sensor histidine kinase [Paenibacillus cremeus]|uniref:histidine kinase n=1 Tax=Paenibacillus cremeus TaxID=2163881 RepID=A0A559K438_9BACL|nr:hypothetical protein [Paenibacillus cremeus]TVY06867.1 hypothetical protein FPZ49_27105 [Paenibacillus cremeus]
MFSPALEQKGIELHLELAETKIVADEDQLNQVWLNLLQNSIKFTPAAGQITLELTFKRRWPSFMSITVKLPKAPRPSNK